MNRSPNVHRPDDPGSIRGDHIDAHEIATLAGNLLRQIQDGWNGADRDLGKAGDYDSNILIHRLLSERHPGDHVFSEETADDLARLVADRVWIVDPVDGTREYGERRDDWAVHVALWEKGLLTAGAVALPAQGVTYSTGGGLPELPPIQEPPRILVSRTRPSPLADRIAEATGGVLVPMGSAGAKAMAIIQGKAEIYAHSGGQYQWDSAAPVAVAASTGLHTSRLDGAPLEYNVADTRLTDLLVCRPGFAETVIAVAREFGI